MVALTSNGDGKPSGPKARSVINALMQQDWRIVHIAAHGEPPELLGPKPVKPGDPPQRIGNPRGVVLSNEVYLSPREINSMRTIPELVFVNCCYLAAAISSSYLRRSGWTARTLPQRPRRSSRQASPRRSSRWGSAA